MFTASARNDSVGEQAWGTAIMQPALWGPRVQSLHIFGQRANKS